MGWCPRTGKGQRLMFKEAVSEYIWLATCQGKIYENKPDFWGGLLLLNFQKCILAIFGPVFQDFTPPQWCKKIVTFFEGIPNAKVKAWP